MAETASFGRTGARPANNLLRTLRDADYALIEPYLIETDSGPSDVLYHPGDNVDVVYFPCGPSMVSYLISGEDGRDVETVLVGREGAVGGIVSYGHLPAYSRIVVKYGGLFVRLPVNNLEAAKERSPTLRNFFARYADCLLAQIFQSTACNAIHTIEQRAAKWMIAAIERTGDDVVPFTHEDLAGMLGAGRSHTTRVLRTFRDQDLIETRRGSVLVRDSAALKRLACKCDDLVRTHFDDVLHGVYPRESR
ncbi:MAG TPA: Crp/Fnr family transcriptional regulator [Xanthobacteraceae bacterium]|nr:Crp/Fnr family transcriptional regulator [Xanthobacteraceae bacterium]